MKVNKYFEFVQADLEPIKSFYLKDELNPKIWNEDSELDSEVREQLLQIAQDFYESTELKADVVDIILTGSLSNYNWSEKYSDYDLIAHIRPTTPQRDVFDIDSAIKKFATSKHDSIRSVHEMSESAYKSFEISKKNQLKPIANLKFSLDNLNKPRQAFKNTYVANGVIDIYRKKFILKNKKLFGKKVIAYITKHTEEIDSLNQFNYIDYLLKK
jgi:CMP-N-acetylneuraminic acid synthetase